MNSTSTAALSAGAASLALTNPAVIAGTASIPVFALAPTGSVGGAFLTQTPSFVGSWVLSRTTSGMQGDTPQNEIVARGDQNFLEVASSSPILTLTASSALTLTVNAVAGSMMLTVVQ